MRKVIFGVVCGLWAMGGVLPVQAVENTRDAQREKIKTLRAALVNKMPAVNDQFDHDHNGMNPVYTMLLKQYQDAQAPLRKQIETESAKTGEARDQALI